MKDTATEAYKNAAQTLVSARVKINGGAGFNDIAVIRVEDNGGSPNPVPGDPAEVEALLEPLWLKHLLVPLRSHGFAQPAARDFPTRHSPRPTGATLDQTLLELPFFEVRGALDQSWCGWDNSPPGWPEDYPSATPDPCYDTDKGSVYYLANFTRYFFDQRACVPPYGSADVNCEFSSVTPPADCSIYTGAACGAAGCKDENGECVARPQVTMTWRGDTVDTLHFTGPILHQVRFEYDPRGVLRSAHEIMVPDSNPGSGADCSADPCAGSEVCRNDVCVNPVNSALAGCVGGYCAQANIALDPSLAWTSAPCTF
ncbi:MAG: hypothetical protein HYZ27_11815 [Deltaproteobacteria bacterium]|nr:hypothetical protein [Deltaproteobacteria bacterium]